MKKLMFILGLMIGILGASNTFAQETPAAKTEAAPAPAASVTPAAPAEKTSATETEGEMEVAAPEKAAPLSAEKMTKIQQAAEKLIKDEIQSVGSFEVDHPETGDLLNLTLDRVNPEVTQSDEGEYLLHADFKDKAGAAYKVSIYVEDLGNEEYELADAIIEAIDGKPVTGI
jgi:hypothetical protein